ncbi:chaperone modulator CbpM [Rasiella sp. SM2506]|uniref:chaperone modulator CbpM n=1 Tax=Rasiella sp. SM2506 TaxID=3423914 RepID=UPI003D7A8AB8
MKTKEYITVTHLCTQYEVTTQWFNQLHETGLVHIVTVQKEPCIHLENIHQVDKIIRLHQELNVNPEGIDIILNLLEKIDSLQAEMNSLQSQLHLYKE